MSIEIKVPDIGADEVEVTEVMVKVVIVLRKNNP